MKSEIPTIKQVYFDALQKNADAGDENSKVLVRRIKLGLPMVGGKSLKIVP